MRPCGGITPASGEVMAVPGHGYALSGTTWG
jgi:hypothetical protein